MSDEIMHASFGATPDELRKLAETIGDGRIDAVSRPEEVGCTDGWQAKCDGKGTIVQ